MTRAVPADRRRFLAGLLLAAAALALGLALRHQLVEPRDVAVLCRAGDAPAWCGVREVLVWCLRQGVFGWLGLAAAVAALLARWPGLVWPALAAGGIGAALYQAEVGAAAVLVALLAALRVPASRASPNAASTAAKPTA